MSLKHAILGMLTREPMSGYQIKATFRESIRNFWNVSDGQLYPTLKKLDDDGFVDREEINQGGVKKHLYTLTPQGRTEFKAWLTMPETTLPELKEPFLLKMIFFDELKDDQIVELLREHVRASEDSMQEIRDVRAEKREASASPFERVVHDMALLMIEARTMFLEELLRAVETGTLEKKLHIFDDDTIDLGKTILRQMVRVVEGPDATQSIREMLGMGSELGLIDNEEKPDDRA